MHRIFDEILVGFDSEKPAWSISKYFWSAEIKIRKKQYHHGYVWNFQLHKNCHGIKSKIRYTELHTYL